MTEPTTTDGIAALFDAGEDDAFGALAAKVQAGGRVSAGGLWGSSQALALAHLQRSAQGPWLVVTASDEEAQLFIEDLTSFGVESLWLPAREGATVAGRRAAIDPERVRQRLSAAQELAGPKERRPRLVVASLRSLLQPIPSTEDIEGEFLSLSVNQHLEAEPLLERLVGSGYTRQPLAESPGEVSLRGDILDIYPYAAELPLRIELFDDEIESLRTFDPADQRSVEKLNFTRVCLARDAGGIEDGDGVQPLAQIAPTTVIVQVEPLRIDDAAEGLRIRSGSHARALLQYREALKGHRRLVLQSLPGEDLTFDVRSVQALGVGMRIAPTALKEEAADGTRVVVVCQNEGERDRFQDLVDQAGATEQVQVVVGALSRGFRFPALGLLAVHHRELTGLLGRRRQPKARTAHRSRAIQSFFDLKLGDYVVHTLHGLARFEGLVHMRRGEGEEEHLKLVFADEVSLFVPAARIDLVQRYIGSGSAAPPLDKLGGQSFRKKKERVERALYDLAAELLEVQAKRELNRRDAWTPDADLVASMISAFPYVDTKDQATTDAELAKDLTGPRPMDRLICGDVGFGKTELAIRAAFRVASAGGQVAVLVPTTVLAQQHYEVFSERLADFPVRIEMMSRYVTGKRSREIRDAVAEGQVDILIGTHRVLSKDVRFQRLGLLIIDEEQRFGVTHKEHFKKLRSGIDILTLTATPIPRTLHMSLSGIRDISALTTPPDGRQEIETVLLNTEDQEELRTALLREVQRDGQVFFLHNRVHSIEARARELMTLVPECSYAIGHGQMGARELKRVMDSFTHGDVDVLVATTIIESGIDIPSAGTIMIDDADHFGLSELHQLRGRVGRGNYKGFCYLLIEPHKPLRQVAKDRLKALEEMNQLGAGFAISMKDLEIRGAGNILGPEQSGHISSVGYDMYCRLLKQTVDHIKAGGNVEDVPRLEDQARGCELELGIDAFLPLDWIPSVDARLAVLRELSEVHDEADLNSQREVLRDRFGRLPEAAENLLRLFELRMVLESHGVTRLAHRGETYLVEYTDRVALEEWLGGTGCELRPVRTGVAHLAIPEGSRGPEDSLQWLEGLLRGPERPPRMTPAGG